MGTGCRGTKLIGSTLETLYKYSLKRKAKRFYKYQGRYPECIQGEFFYIVPEKEYVEMERVYVNHKAQKYKEQKEERKE